MKRCIAGLLLLGSSFVIAGGKGSNYQVDDRYVVDGEYCGRFCPGAEYVLSGQYAKDIAPLPEVPWHYRTAEEGYRQDAMSPVPAPGVHPRVLMNMDDIKRIRKLIDLGDKAPFYFQRVYNAVKGSGDLSLRGMLALAMDDKEAGREAADKYMEHVRRMEPVIDIINTHPDTAEVRDNYWYYRCIAIDTVGGIPYMKAYREGGADHVRELAKKGISCKLDSTTPENSGRVSAGSFVPYDYLHAFLTEEERAVARRVIKKLTYGRYTSGWTCPATCSSTTT